MADIALTTAPDPVGVPNQDAVQRYIATLEAKWATEAALNPSVPWWEFWKQPIALHQITLFMLQAIDIVVVDLDKAIMANQDKKATALAAIGSLYDVIVIPALPIWAKPFSGVVKSYILDTFISNMIDWLCTKYHTAVWPVPPTPATPAA